MILDLLDVFWRSKGNLLNSVMRLKLRILFSRIGKNAGIYSGYSSIHYILFHFEKKQMRSVRVRSNKQKVTSTNFFKT